ncbi:hypothetical protein T492DRAFT_113251 [Pavlovales sp. CCMP2436]|nr:hypothetical protein T492DRAFT_113251 [Pavlovales sp. CCMP2436]
MFNVFNDIAAPAVTNPAALVVDKTKPEFAVRREFGFRGSAWGGDSRVCRGRAERVQPGSAGTRRAGSAGFSGDARGGCGLRDAHGTTRGGNSQKKKSSIQRGCTAGRIQWGRAGRVQSGSEGPRGAGPAGFSGDVLGGKFSWVQRGCVGRARAQHREFGI